MRPERAYLRLGMANLMPERVNLRPERAYFRPVMDDLRPGMANLRLGSVNLRPGSACEAMAYEMANLKFRRAEWWPKRGNLRMRGQVRGLRFQVRPKKPIEPIKG